MDPLRGTSVHAYETRGMDDYWTGRHRTVTFENVPSQTGVRFLNKLPNSVKSATLPKAFKTLHKYALIAEAFYNHRGVSGK